MEDKNEPFNNTSYQQYLHRTYRRQRIDEMKKKMRMLFKWVNIGNKNKGSIGPTEQNRLQLYVRGDADNQTSAATQWRQLNNSKHTSRQWTGAHCSSIHDLVIAAYWWIVPVARHCRQQLESRWFEEFTWGCRLVDSEGRPSSAQPCTAGEGHHRSSTSVHGPPGKCLMDCSR